MKERKQWWKLCVLSEPVPSWREVDENTWWNEKKKKKKNDDENETHLFSFVVFVFFPECAAVCSQTHV